MSYKKISYEIFSKVVDFFQKSVTKILKVGNRFLETLCEGHCEVIKILNNLCKSIGNTQFFHNFALYER